MIHLDEIADYISANDSVSFAELTNRWPGLFANGDMAFCNAKYPNIVYWTGMTADGARVTHELAERFDVEGTSALVYLVDGMALKFPLAKSLRAYKKPHWLPVVFKVRKH